MPLLAHVSAERTPADRGRAFGRAQQRAVEHTITVYRRLFAETCGLGGSDIERFGASVAQALTDRCPHVLEEIVGLAAGAGVSAEELAAVNARTELLAGATEPECPVVASEPRGTPCAPCLLAQTWDWHPALEQSRVVWTVRQPADTWFVTVTEAGILGKIGLNSSGIGCGLNFLTSAADGGAHGVPIHVLLRLVLSDCTSLCAALELLLNAPAAASSCITVAYADAEGGAVFGVEISPRETAAVAVDPSGLFVHTNHFLREPNGTADVGLLRWPGTLIRHAHLSGRLHELRGRPDESSLRSLFESHFAAPDSVCKHEVLTEPWCDQRRTLVAVVMNLSEPSLAVSDGPPCRRSWSNVALPSTPSVAARIA